MHFHTNYFIQSVGDSVFRSFLLFLRWEEWLFRPITLSLRQLLHQVYWNFAIAHEIIQTDRVTYRIQPKDDKHPVLLPVGETAQFRIHKDKMLLRVPEADGKEREYIVLSMTPRTDVASSRPTTAVVGGSR